jgi:hypothetical protein
VKVTPPVGTQKRAPKTFQIKPNTKINGELKEGVGATVYYHEEEGLDTATRIDTAGYLRGLLTPANAPGPPDISACGGRVPPDAMRILFGNSEAYSLDDRYVVWNVSDEDLLVLQKTTAGLSVSVTVRDSSGAIAAEIVDNHFFVNVHDFFRIDTLSSHSLVLYDGAGKQVFDIEFLNPRTVKILGTFFGRRGEQISIAEDQQKFGGLIMSRNCFGGGGGAIKMY